jgi:geranylgeranyl pyrophosphate synthase
VELIHTYSLVHDDLPCMDDDDLRRGRPTVHVAFGEATAVLAGDALLTEAFAVLAEAPAPAEVKVRMTVTLARAAGLHGMVGGQAIDVGLGGTIADVAALDALHERKTGALITASALLGGMAAGAEELGALEVWGRAVGLAFQLADDLLDAGGDAARPSFVHLLGARATKDRAGALVEEATRAVRDLPRHDRLDELARFAVERTH